MSFLNQNLYQMSSGSSAIVKGIHAQDKMRQRLYDMGLRPSCKVIKERTALGGDPVWIKLEGTQIALRKHEAEAIEIEISND